MDIKILSKMCLINFVTKDELNEHKNYCINNKCTKVVMTEPYNNILLFNNYNYSIKVPVAVYADFECMHEKNTELSTFL
jgi:hypothetical protein